MELEAAYLMASKAAWLYDHGEAAGPIQRRQIHGRRGRL